MNDGDGRTYVIVVADRDGRIIREFAVVSQRAAEATIGDLLDTMPEALLTIRWTKS